MHIGFKTGPKNWEEGKRIITQDGAKMCEIWFRVDKVHEYREMLGYLKAQKVAFGLHYWGLIQNKYKPNIATHHKDIREETIAQMKEAIDVAQREDAVYVNIHPGILSVEEMNFTTHRQAVSSNHEVTPSDTARTITHENVNILHDYALKKGVTLTIETLPAGEVPGSDREEAYFLGDAPISLSQDLADNGFYIANDITHTASQIGLINSEDAFLWKHLLDTTHSLAPQTKLVHVNTVVPPWNGTDSHHGLLPEDYAVNAWPSLDRIAQLISIFKDRDDVYIVPEPNHNMQENYQALVKLIA